MNAEINFPVLLFDGVCNLCNGSVQWVLTHDLKRQFRFAALQSDTGQALLHRFGLDPSQLDTAVLVDGDRVFLRSEVPLEVARRIGGPWVFFLIFRVLPRPLRDGMYNWVARNRYRWFGQQESCMLPRPEWKDRFL